MRKIIFFAFLIFLIVIFGCAALKSDQGGPGNKTLSDLSNQTGLTERKIIEILECENEKTKGKKEICYDKFVKDKMKFKKVKELLLEIDTAANNNNELRLKCHDIAHAIGRKLFYSSNNSISGAFNQCIQTCHAGCYHGALQGMFLEDNYQDENSDQHITLVQLREKVKTACNQFEGEIKNKFQCLHGMGHAIQFYVDNNLTYSLNICDELTTEYEKESCYGGVFMENVVSVNRDTRDIKFNSPLYPCVEMKEKYKHQCYAMQTSVMIELFGEDIEKLNENCKNSDADYRGICFRSFGRDMSNHFRIKSRKPYEVLGKIESDYKKEYIGGLTYALADNTWNGLYAFPFCSGINEPQLKSFCYSNIIKYLNWNLDNRKEEIVNSCEKHAPVEDMAYCINLARGLQR